MIMDKIIEKLIDAEKLWLNKVEETFYTIFNSTKTIEWKVNLYNAINKRLDVVNKELFIKYLELRGVIYKRADENDRTSEFYDLIWFKSEEEPILADN